jgi:hypothetical protein
MAKMTEQEVLKWALAHGFKPDEPPIQEVEQGLTHTLFTDPNNWLNNVLGGAYHALTGPGSVVGEYTGADKAESADPKTTKKKPKASTKEAPVAESALAQAESSALTPLVAGEQELGQESKAVLGGLDPASPGAQQTLGSADAAVNAAVLAGGNWNPGTGSAALQSAEQNAAQAAMGGAQEALAPLEPGPQGQPSQMAQATSNAVTALPWSDLVNTLLQQQKNALLYGYPPAGEVQLNTKGLPEAFQQIYKYIGGQAAGTSPINFGSSTPGTAAQSGAVPNLNSTGTGSTAGVG